MLNVDGGDRADIVYGAMELTSSPCVHAREDVNNLVLDAKTQFLNVIASFETTIARNRVFLTDSASRASIPCHNKKPLPSLAGVKNYQGASTNICQYSIALWGVTLHG